MRASARDRWSLKIGALFNIFWIITIICDTHRTTENWQIFRWTAAQTGTFSNDISPLYDSVYSKHLQGTWWFYTHNGSHWDIQMYMENRCLSTCTNLCRWYTRLRMWTNTHTVSHFPCVRVHALFHTQFLSHTHTNNCRDRGRWMEAISLWWQDLSSARVECSLVDWKWNSNSRRANQTLWTRD